MLEREVWWERSAFFFLNGSHTPFWNHFMWLYSGKWVWIPAAALLLFLLVYRRKWKEILFLILSLVLVVTLCDQFASHLCKPLFMRLRPTHQPGFMDQVQTVNGYRGGLYGFMSSHSANAFGLATYLVWLMHDRLFRIGIYLWAALTAYSRIYLGVHFISDVLAGALVGFGFGLLVYALYAAARKKWSRGTSYPSPPSAAYPHWRGRVALGGILLTVAFICGKAYLST